ncbi:MAG: diguanylate cyclase, partial [Candidatus Rokuibacteriota bacterium]
LLFLADRALQQVGGAAGGGNAGIVFGTIALLLPLDLAALAWTAERGVLSRRARWLVVALVAQPLALALLVQPEASPLAALVTAAPAALRGVTPLTVPALAAFGLAFVLVVVRVALHRTALHAGAAWAVLAAFCALAGGGETLGASLYFATGGLVLVIALIEASHGMAYGDELTGLPARRALNEALVSLGDQYAVAMVDIDHFKKFNDTHGHAVGDQLLRMVGATLERVAGGGRAFRYGGEEFAVIFPGKSMEDALPHLEELRHAIATAPFAVRGHGRPRRRPETPRASNGARNVNVTVSIGVAGPGRRLATPDQVIKAADKALYRAKKAGRNRVCT